MKRVVVGMSGGVDSSVAAYLLKEAGYDVIGMFMRNWHDDSVTLNNECPWVEDSNDALIAANHLGIPFQTIDLSKAYKARIVDYMFSEYKNGRTPNPDVLCNREIKFDVFLKHALSLGADYVATGHYCRKDEIKVGGENFYRLLSGNDAQKDQSYFLCQITQAQLSRIIFPIGELTKPRVREIAEEISLPNAHKKDSQGLCFVGKVKLPDFLQQQLKPKKGPVIEIKEDNPVFAQTAEGRKSNGMDLEQLTQPFRYQVQMGMEVGTHPGAHYFTIGQRKGLNIGGKEKPLFVLDKDTKHNILYTGQGEDHPGLYRPGLQVNQADVHWVRPDLRLESGETMEVLARIRYRQALEPATLHQEASRLFVVFRNAQKGVASGQFVAWYLDDELVGSGVIA